MNLSILVVDDDREAAKIIQGLLTRKFPEAAVHVAENGRVGVERAKEHRPDLVITDINMPYLDGVRMAEEIKALKPATRFIVLSGYSHSAETFAHIGIHAYFVKPADLRKLLGAIHACITEITAEG
jgi:YesN/AraC family two-component response regulator